MSGCGLDVCGVTGKVGKNEGSLHCTEGGGRGWEREKGGGKVGTERDGKEPT